jgi:hypothetical protein
MRGNWISHTATGGSGALTLSRNGNFPAFSDVFGTTGSRVVEYEIDDSVTNYEAGIGVVTLGTPGSTLSLARTYPTTTWNGTTYVATAVTALTFSGTVTVRCSPLAADVGLNLPMLCDTLGDLIPSAGNDAWGGYANSSFAMVIGRLYLQPFTWRGGRSIKKASVYCSTASAGAVLQVGIYELTDHTTATLRLDLTNAGANAFGGGGGGLKTNTSAGGAFPETALPPGAYLQGFYQATAAAAWAGSNFGAAGHAAILGTVSGSPIGTVVFSGATGLTTPQTLSSPLAAQDTFTNPAVYLHLGW